jgi:hypothetical protein
MHMGARARLPAPPPRRRRAAARTGPAPRGRATPPVRRGTHTARKLSAAFLLRGAAATRRVRTRSKWRVSHSALSGANDTRRPPSDWRVRLVRAGERPAPGAAPTSTSTARRRFRIYAPQARVRPRCVRTATMEQQRRIGAARRRRGARQRAHRARCGVCPVLLVLGARRALGRGARRRRQRAGGARRGCHRMARARGAAEGGTGARGWTAAKTFELRQTAAWFHPLDPKGPPPLLPNGQCCVSKNSAVAHLLAPARA